LDQLRGRTSSLKARIIACRTTPFRRRAAPAIHRPKQGILNSQKKKFSPIRILFPAILADKSRAGGMPAHFFFTAM
jgi:hypothetical protein